MGGGLYSHEAHVAITGKRAKLPQQAVFAQTKCHPLMNPRDVRVRESRDSADHPNSLGIVFALDVTGSMGDIPAMLAREELPKFMKVLTDCGVKDAQLLFAAIGDATSDASPLQVGQFESTAQLMDQWLTWSHIERGGGGTGEESYELGIYFLAEHTDMDCWVKRKKRGYMFMTGDERPYPAVSKGQVEGIVGDRLDADVPLADAVAALQETFHPFFLIPDLARRKHCEGDWREVLGDHVICMESPHDTSFVAAAVVALTEGLVAGTRDLSRILADAGASADRVPAILRAVTPYAGLLGKDDAPPPPPPAPGRIASAWKRLIRA